MEQVTPKVGWSRRAAVVALALAVVAAGFVIAEDTAAVAGPGTGYLDDIPTTTPSNLGDLDLTELQYGDPTEALDLVQPPKADADGGASVAHPLSVPAGRAGVQPDLELTYGSDAGSSWVGTGWDLSVGAVTVETEFGAPRYLTAEESETYALDGDRLFPNAIRTDLEERVAGPRADWVRQVEDDHDLIVRHGDAPDAYCWQVSDTEGNHRWYGGVPDGDGGCERDASAVLTAQATGAPGGGAGDFHWALTYVQDISGNTMRFSYDEITGVPIGRAAENDPFGTSLYLREITYTGFNDPEVAADHPAYRVRFLRDGDVDGVSPRRDVNVDAGAGAPVVTAELLRRIEVEHLGADHYDTGAPPQLVKGWTLEYEHGPFDKSLLTRVGQFGSEGADAVHAWHEFTWFDDVRDPVTGEYRGFGEIEEWGTGAESTKPNIAAESALGTSWRAGGDGGAYIGFNPAIPSKIGSFGGSFNIAGGQTHEVGTLVDLDGDGLPDKVWVADSGVVMYRPNLSRPGNGRATGQSWFGEAQTITRIDSGSNTSDLDGLGRSSDLRIDLHFEAYPVVTLQVGGGFGFSFGDQYFEDANGDGRVDFVMPGAAGPQTVYFNVLVDGVPTFVDSSVAAQLEDRLEVPLDAFDTELSDDDLGEVRELLVNTSPRIDTVRRWLAPHDGTISVEGAVGLVAGGEYRGDGAAVSIEHGGGQPWSRTLTAASPTAEHAIELDVEAGDAVWFRLHVIESATDDAITWAPEVSYVDLAAADPAPAPDANGRSQVHFDAVEDFTLFGRSGARTSLSEAGDLTVTVAVDAAEKLSDELEVTLLHGRGRGTPTAHPVVTVPQRTTGDHAGSVDLTVAAPATTAGEDGHLGTEDDVEEADWIEVHVTSDSPVDPTAFSVQVTTSAPSPDAPDTSGIPAQAELELDVEVPVAPNVRVFSRTDHVAPYAPVTPREDSEATFEVVLDGPQIADGDARVTSAATITAKTIDGGVIERKSFTVAHSGGRLTGSEDLVFDAVEDTPYYLEVSVVNPAVGAAVDLKTSKVTFRWEETDADGQTSGEEHVVDDAGQLHWPDADGLFPSGNRGWAYAGYNADHADADGGGPLVEGQMRLEAETKGYDEDTEVPDADESPSAAEVRPGDGSGFDPAMPYIAWAGPSSDMADRWRAGGKATLHGQAASMQSDRLGADIRTKGAPSAGRAAPQMMSVDGDFNFMVGLVASFTAAIGGGRALRDYEDYNGDGYPDIRIGTQIEYTGPRGANAVTTSVGQNTIDSTVAVGGGLGGSPVATSSTGAASKNGDAGGVGSNVEPTSTKSSRGMKVGLGFDLEAQWTNAVGSEADDELSEGGDEAVEIRDAAADDRASDDQGNEAWGALVDRTMLDVNGDGLPDRVSTYDSGQMWVHLNLGYRFAGDAVQWSTGRTASNKDVSGSLSVGFELNAYEFAGGVAYSEGVGYSQFGWMDIDGDGVPDRMDNVGDAQPRTVFGSADGMHGDEITYGEYHKGNVAVDADRWQAERDEQGNLRGVDLPGGSLEVSRTTGLSGGFDFAVYIGPICAVACYVVVNPGVHAGYDRMVSQVDMVDMNGDGWLDAVRSTGDEHLEVRLNQRGRSNMLQSVTNPLGGQFRLDYQRTGNTIENPESVWVLSSVEVDDGRGGDGPDVQRSEFTYEGNTYDPLLRELLGFSWVREEQVDIADPADPADDTVLRSYERTYLNGNPFESGLLASEKTFAGDGSEAEGHTPVQEAAFTWGFANADPAGGVHGEHGAAVTELPAVGKTARTLLFDTALSPRLLTDALRFTDAEGDSQTTATHFTYNTIGDVLTVHEQNETEIDEDDTFTEITYSDCAARDGARDIADIGSWVSVAATVSVYGNDEASGELLRHRDGSPGLCDNAAPVRIAELVDPDDGNGCGPLYAVTEMWFDDHGSYNAVAHPRNQPPTSCGDYPEASVDYPSDVDAPADGEFDFRGCATLDDADDAVRYCVDYVYDEHRFTDIASVTDNHGVSSSATYDPFTSRLASRTDENGNVTTYGYDDVGRIRSVTAPREQGGAAATVTYAYGGLDATLDPSGAHAWATSHHHDVFNAGNTIDTATFVDGLGRTVQRKRDAEVDGVDGEARIVEGAIEYDALGREVKEWYPVVERVDDRALTAYNPTTSESGVDVTGVPVTSPTERTFNTLGNLTSQRLPDGSVEQVVYDFDELPDPLGAYDAAIVMSRVHSTDPLGKATTRWLDVGGAVFVHDEAAAPANDPDGPAGPLGSLPGDDALVPSRIADSTATGAPIRTVYEYDRLGRLTGVIDAAGARTAHTYDRQDAVTSTDTPDGGLVERRFSPSGHLVSVKRAVGTVASYSYDRDRLVGVDYSDDTPDVSYLYGASAGAAENVAGRVTRVVDGSMTRTYGYDSDGNVSRETATKHPDPFGKGVDDAPPTWETAWRYDSLGRLERLTYPDGEELAHDYDLGGRPVRLVSQAPQHDLYDQYGNTVARPDVEIVYVDEVRYDQFGEATYMRTGTGVESHYEYEPTRRFLAGVATDSTAVEQYDGTTSVARPLQRLEYRYDVVGNVRDTTNRLYEEPGDTSVDQLGPPPENNVPGPSQHAFTYDGHYRLTGGTGTYIDRTERRDFTFEADYAPNGNLASKRMVTTTTSTTKQGGGGKSSSGSQNEKKGDGSGTDGTTTDTTCESNTGSGGGSFNQDPETTYVVSPGDLRYADDGDGHTTHRLAASGFRTYSHDENGNMTGWVQPCASGSGDITRSFEWDAENRIRRISEGNNDTHIRYSAEGARALERGPGGTTWFVNEHWRTVNDGHRYASVYLGERLIASHRTDPQPPPPPPCTDTAEVPCPCESDGACVQDAATCDVIAMHFDEASGTCQPMEERTIHFLHTDLQGSLRVATDEVGAVFQYLDYLPTGRPWVAGQSTIKDTPHLFAGGWTDTTYDLVNFGQRWYEPREAGFLSTEPLLEDDPYAAVDDPSLLAAYTYAAANPLRYTDADGRAPRAANGYRLGKSSTKHESGDVSVSVATRAARQAPAITFGGRYSNNATGQALAVAMKEHNDRAERFSTVLAIETEDGVRKIRVFGLTVDRAQVGPDPGPGDPGADRDDAPASPPAPATSPPTPDATDSSDDGSLDDSADAADSSDDGADGSGASAPPPDRDDGDNDAPVTPPSPPAAPMAASPGADGPDLD